MNKYMILLLGALAMSSGCSAAAPHVTVYTQPGCGYCENLVNELHQDGITFNVVGNDHMFMEHPTTVVCNHGLCMRVVGDNPKQIIEDMK